MIKKSLDQSCRGINKLSMKLFISIIFDIYLTTFKLAGYNSKCFKENIIFFFVKSYQNEVIYTVICGRKQCLLRPKA
jgi:hypothetical protein